MGQMYDFMRITQESIAKERHRKMAVMQSGHAFIVLELLDPKKRRVSAVDELVAYPTDRKGKYRFETVSRQLMFEPDANQGGMDTAYVLDTLHNRRFLASHLDCGYWEIIEVISGRKGTPLVIEEVLAELYVLRGKLAEDARKSAPGYVEIPKLLPENTMPFDVGKLSEDVLEKELERRKKERILDVGNRVPENEPEQTSNEKAKEAFDKLSPAEKGKITKAKNKAKKHAAIMKSSKKSEIVVDSKKTPVVSSGKPISSFLKQSPVGMVQP